MFLTIPYRCVIVDSNHWKELHGFMQEHGLKPGIEHPDGTMTGDYVISYVRGYFDEPNRAYVTTRVPIKSTALRQRLRAVEREEDRRVGQHHG